MPDATSLKLPVYGATRLARGAIEPMGLLLLLIRDAKIKKKREWEKNDTINNAAVVVAAARRKSYAGINFIFVFITSHCVRRISSMLKKQKLVYETYSPDQLAGARIKCMYAMYRV